jgi:hypothetical protein
MSSKTVCSQVRVWIIQECTLNPRLILMSEDLNIEWDALMDIATYVSSQTNTELNAPWNSQSLTWPYLDDIKGLRALLDPSRSSERPCLLEAVFQFASSRSTNVCDKIYGFRAIARDGENFDVDYNANLFAVFVDAISLHNRRCFENCEEYRSRNWWKPAPGCPNILRDGQKLAKMLMLRATDIPSALSNLPSDWLVIPVRRSDPSPERKPYTRDIDLDSDCALTRVVAERAVPGTYEDDVGSTLHRPLFLVRALRCGRLLGVAIYVHDPSEQFDWRGHIWVCRFTLAVHVSRALFVLCIGCSELLRTESSSPRASQNNILANLPPADEATRGWCNCRIKTRPWGKSPWAERLHDTPCKGPVDLERCNAS